MKFGATRDAGVTRTKIVALLCKRSTGSTHTKASNKTTKTRFLPRFIHGMPFPSDQTNEYLTSKRWNDSGEKPNQPTNQPTKKPTESKQAKSKQKQNKNKNAS